MTPRRPLIPLVLLAFAVLACNLSGGSVDAQATVLAAYETLTVQAEDASDAPAEEASATPPPDEDGGDAAPGITPTAPTARTGNGTNLTVPPCSGGMTVDGAFDDWDTLTGVPRFPLTNVVFGAEQWRSDDDLSAEASLCWQEDALALIVFVTDDTHVQNQTGRTIYLGDEVEIVIDTALREDFYEEQTDSDDVHIGLSPGDFGEFAPTSVIYQPELQEWTEPEVASMETDNGYRLEALIPWGIVGITPEPGTGYGLCIAVSDNDQPNEASQDSFISHCTRLSVFNPTTWVTAQFAP